MNARINSRHSGGTRASANTSLNVMSSSTPPNAVDLSSEEDGSESFSNMHDLFENSLSIHDTAERSTDDLSGGQRYSYDSAVNVENNISGQRDRRWGLLETQSCCYCNHSHTRPHTIQRETKTARTCVEYVSLEAVMYPGIAAELTSWCSKYD